jgi:tape measure domain-containing protein
MSDAIKNITFKISTDTGAAGVGLSNLEKHTDKTTKKMTEMESVLKRIKVLVASVFAINMFKNVTMGAVEAVSSFEKSTVSFEVMLKSADKAKKLLEEITQFSATTPFQQEEIEGSARTLLAFGFSAEQVIPLLRQIGDVAAGTNQPIGELVEIFGKARASGRIMNDDLNQLANRGIPVYELFAKQLGVGTDQVRKLSEQGKIGFSNLEKAFQTLTSEGGLFTGLMEKQSKTTGGQISNLKDNVSLLMREIGQGLKPVIDTVVTTFSSLVSMIRGVPEFVRNHATAFKILGMVIVTVGTAIASYKAYTIAASAAQALYNLTLKSGTFFATAWRGAQILASAATALFSGNLNRATAALRLFNTVTKLNPFGVIVAGIAAIGTAIYMFGTKVSETAKIQKMLADVSAEANKRVADEKVKLELLVDVAKDENRTKAERLRAIKELNRISPEYLGNINLENINTKETTEAVNKYIAALEKKARAQAALEKRTELEKEIIDLTTDKTKSQPGWLQSFLMNINPQNWGVQKATGQNASDVIAEANQKEAIEAIKAQIDALNDYIAKNKIDITDAITTGGTGVDTNTAIEKKVHEVENIVKKLQAELQKLTIENLDFGANEAVERFKNEIDKLPFIAEDGRKAINDALYSSDIPDDERKAIIDAELKKAAIRAGAVAEAEKVMTDRAKKVKEITEDKGLSETERNSLIEKIGSENDIRVQLELIIAEKIREVEENLSEQRTEIRIRENEKLQAILAERIQLVLETAQIMNDSEISRIQTERDSAIQGLDKQIEFAKTTEEIQELERKKAAIIIEAAERIYEFKMDLIAKERDALIQKYEIEIQNAGGNAEAIKNIKIKKTNELLRLNQKEIDAENEKNQAATDTANNLDKLVKKHGENTEAIIDGVTQVINETISGLQQLLNAQIQLTDQTIQLQQERVDKAKEIASQGNAALLEAEKERLRKLQEQRAAYVKRQQALAAVELVINSTVAIAKAAAEGGAAAPYTIAATLIALAIGLAAARAQASATATGFKKGGYTGDASPDKVVGVVHGQEYVVPAGPARKHRALLEAISGKRADVSGYLEKAMVLGMFGKDNDSRIVGRLDRLEKAMKSVKPSHFSITREGIHAVTYGVEHDLKRLGTKLGA